MVQLRTETLNEILDLEQIAKGCSVRRRALGRWTRNVNLMLEHRGLNRNDLADLMKKAGLPVTDNTTIFLHYVLHGQRNPSLQMQVNIARALELPPDDMYLTTAAFRSKWLD